MEAVPTKRRMSSHRTILVTGATGFLGGRIVERLIAEGNCSVRVLVRSMSRAVRVASLPVEYYFGDVTDATALAKASVGCEAVIHCASRIESGIAPEKTTTFLGVQSAAQVCKQTGAKLIHISSCSVYGIPDGRDVDENAPLRPRHGRDVYGRAKIAAEQFLKDYVASQDMKAAILQPTLIYGPYSEEWTLSPLAMLSDANIALPDGDTGVCNAVYVDDVASAALLALDKCDARCRSYLINGGELPSWADYFARHEAIGTKGRVVRFNEAELNALRQSAAQGKSLFRAGMRIMREQPAVRSAIMSTSLVSNAFALMQKFIPTARFESLKNHLTGRKTAAESPVTCFPNEAGLQTKLPAPHFLELVRQSHRYNCARAKSELGYNPAFSLDRAFEIIGPWAKWSRIV